MRGQMARGAPRIDLVQFLFRQRSRSDLELHDLWSLTFAALLVPGRVHRIARPEAAALPTRIGVIDASRSGASGESERIRDAQGQRRHLSALRHHDKE